MVCVLFLLVYEEKELAYSKNGGYNLVGQSVRLWLWKHGFKSRYSPDRDKKDLGLFFFRLMVHVRTQYCCLFAQVPFLLFPRALSKSFGAVSQKESQKLSVPRLFFLPLLPLLLINKEKKKEEAKKIAERLNSKRNYVLSS